MRRSSARPRPTAWPAVMRLALYSTLISLVIPTAQYLGGDDVVIVARWIMLGLTCAMFLVRPRRSLQLRKPNQLDAAATAFFAFAMGSVLYSSDPRLTILRALSVALLYFAVFWTMWTYADYVGDLKISNTILQVAVLVFIAGIGNLLLTDAAWMKERFRGVLENPNALGMIAVGSLPLAVAKLMRERTITAVSMTALIIGSVILSGSRNGVLAASLGIVFLLFRLRVWKAGFLIASAGAVLYLSMPSSSVSAGPATTSLTRLVPDSMLSMGSGRVEAWQIAIPIIRRNIAFGHGFGTEESIFEGVSFLIHRGEYVHNSYLGLTYQLGLIGAILLFGPLLWLFFTRLLARRKSTVQTAAYEAVLLGGLVASFFESWIYSAGNAFAFPFWICVMFLARITLGAPETADIPARVRTGLGAVTRFQPRFQPALATHPVLPAPAGTDLRRFDPPAVPGRA